MGAEIISAENPDMVGLDEFDFVVFDPYLYGADVFYRRSGLRLNTGLVFFTHSVLCWFKMLILIRPYLTPKDVVITPSRFSQRSLSMLYRGVSSVRLSYFSDSSDILSGCHDDFMCVYLGRLRPDKGVLETIQAIESIRTAHPALRLAIIGPPGGDSTDAAKSPYAALLERYVREHGLDEAVRFCGALTGREKSRVLSRAGLLLLPTTCSQEAQPFSVIEALRHGVPVVATRWAALDGELVQDGITGFLADVSWHEGAPGVSHKAIADAIGRYLTLPRRDRQAMRSAAQASSRRFGKRQVIPALRAILAQKAPINLSALHQPNMSHRRIGDMGDLFGEIVTGSPLLSNLTLDDLRNLPHEAGETLRTQFIKDNLEAFYRQA